MSYEYIFACDEPGGQVIRYVRPLEAMDIKFVYNKITESFGERSKVGLPWHEALNEFMRLDKLYWVVDDVGLIIANKAGDVHVFFWDKRLRGRELMCRAMARIVCEIFELPAVWTEIPRSERAVLAFSRRVGFREVAGSPETVTLSFDKGAL
jgi:hypothetical protein